MNLQQATGWTIDDIREMNAAEREEVRRKLEAENLHTLAAMVEFVDDQAAMGALEAIQAEQDAAGYLTAELSERRQAVVAKARNRAYEEWQAEQEQHYIDTVEKPQERRFAEWLEYPGDR